MDDKEFLVYANNIVAEAQKQGAIIRLLGAVAFNIHCPTYGRFQQEAKRHFTDLDFAAYFTHNDAIRKAFLRLGFEEDREVAVVFARQRLIFFKPGTELHVDIFFDKLDFCHPIPWTGRLEVDNPTIPLAELLLEKMQIVQINQKDVIDSIMLLREHSLNNSDQETINANRIAAMCAKDWGLWRTVTMNLKKVCEISQGYTWLAADDRAVVVDRIDQLLNMIDKEPKTTAWTVRSKIGDRVKWYKEVHEVAQ
jgi:hypothetical protein